MEGSYNARCPAVKRLFREAQELREATEEYFAQPLDDNLFEWHFTVRGPPETAFDGGIYHGRIILPADYPMKPPNIIFLTPNGRFETNKKICLSISGHHPETWQPSWSIRTALLAIIGFMPTPAIGTIGGLDYTPVERQTLAKKSQDYCCTECGKVAELLRERTGNSVDIQKEAKEVAAQIVTAKPEDSESMSSSNGSNKKTEASSSKPQQSSDDGPIFESVISPSVNQRIASNNVETLTNTQNSPRTNANTSESVPPRDSMDTGRPFGSTIPLLANTVLLSAAAFLLLVLIVRRLFFMPDIIVEEADEILLDHSQL